jgi:hypothetical protein
MNETPRLRRWSWRSCLPLGALVLFMVAVSRAHVSLDQLPKQPLDTTTSLVMDARHQEKGETKPLRGPESEPQAWLLIGLGVMGLVAYGLNRRQHRASVVLSPQEALSRPRLRPGDLRPLLLGQSEGSLMSGRTLTDKEGDTVVSCARAPVTRGPCC